MQRIENRPIQVFLVNDHKIVLWGLERLIASAAPGMQVAGTAENCDTLLAQLDFVQPDVVLFDLDCGVGSLSCLERLTANPALHVLVLTGSNDREIHQQAAMLGARGVMHKTAKADTLLRAIEKIHQGEIWLDRTTLGHVVMTLANPRKKPPEAEKLDTLTSKERQIVMTLLQEKGARNKIIADKLHISEHTLRNHFTTIYDKLQVSGRMELYLLASNQRQFGGPQLIAA